MSVTEASKIESRIIHQMRLAGGDLWVAITACYSALEWPKVNIVTDMAQWVTHTSYPLHTSIKRRTPHGYTKSIRIEMLSRCSWSGFGKHG